MDINELIETYNNGNISTVRTSIKNKEYGLSELLDYYIDNYNPSVYGIQLFVRRLS